MSDGFGFEDLACGKSGVTKLRRAAALQRATPYADALGAIKVGDEMTINFFGCGEAAAIDKLGHSA